MRDDALEGGGGGGAVSRFASRWKGPALGLLAGLILLAIWLSTTDTSAMLGAMRQVNVGWLAGGVIAFLGAWLLRSQRWRLLINPVQALRPGEAYGLLMVSVACNSLLPVRAGEVAIGFALRSRRQLPISLALTSLAVDKICDLFPVILLLSLGPLALPVVANHLPDEVLVLISAGLVLAFVGGIGLYVLGRQDSALRAVGRRVASALPRRLVDRFAHRVTALLDGLALIARQPSNGVAIVLLTLGATALDLLSFYATFRAFGLQMSFVQLAFGSTLFMLTSLVPGPPGKLGSYEVAMLLVFSSLLGLPSEIVGAHAIVRHLLLLGVIAVVGVLASVWLGATSRAPLDAETQASDGQISPTLGSGASLGSRPSSLPQSRKL